MRIPIRPGRSRVLAIAASVLLSGSALAAATLPAQAAAASPGILFGVITVNTPGAVTEPLETKIDLPLTATDTDTAPAVYPLTWTASPNLALLGLTVAATNADGTEAAITGTVPAADVGTYKITVTATDGEPASGMATFDLTLGNTVTVTSPGNQLTPLGTAIKPLAIATKDTDTAATFIYAATDLPAGLAIDPLTGVITGKPTVAGTKDVTVTATDDTGAAGAAKFTWTVGVANKVAVTAPAKKTVWDGVAVSLKLTATDSAPAQALTWSAAGLPPGLAINAATGVISGRPAKLGDFSTVAKATDGTGSSGTATIKWDVAVPVIIPNPGTQTTTVGQWLTIQPFRYSDAVAGDKPAFSATGLPSGMSFQGAPMLFYGWPQTGGTYHVTIHERGSLGTADTRTFAMVVHAAPVSGGTGQIHLPFAGKCLQDPGNRTANGTRVEIESCVSGASESWTVSSDNTVHVHGRCLTIAGSGSSAGRQLVLEACTGGARQRWAEGNHGELVNPASGECLTDPGASKRNGTVPVTGTCHTQSYEQWTLPAQRVLTALGGSCLDTSSNGAIGQRIDEFWCQFSGSYWTFEPDGTIRMFGNKCITVKSKKAVIGLCSAGNSTQKWTVARTSAMGSELSEGGVCLAIPSMTADRGTRLETNDTQLITSKCSNTDPRDLWHIE